MERIYSALASVGQIMPDFLDRFCFINGAVLPLDEVEKMGHDEFSLRYKINMPVKLYKYYPNTLTQEKDKETNEAKLINYSHKSLINNEVFLNTPLNFDDVYDSDIHISSDKYIADRLEYYCSLCTRTPHITNDVSENIRQLSAVFYEAKLSEHDIIRQFNTDGLTEKGKLVLELFIAQVKLALLQGSFWPDSVMHALELEYRNLMQSIRTLFRITCFTTTPFSQRMWGSSYANNHKGFCVEYTINPNDTSLQKQYFNLFPVIYCNKRADIEKELLHWLDEEISSESYWKIHFHGVLRKSFNWADQNEWRLLLPHALNQSGYTVPFFPITKVYIGNRMEDAQKKELIDICHSRGIPYAGMIRAADKFEMQECPTLCENCSHFIR